MLVREFENMNGTGKVRVVELLDCEARLANGGRKTTAGLLLLARLLGRVLIIGDS